MVANIFFVFSFYLIVFAGGILVIYNILFNVFPDSTRNVFNNAIIDQTDKFKPAKTFSSYDDTAYVFLALGASANQMNCPAAIESLVKYSGWDGHIYLITDRKSCFDKQEIIANAGMDSSKFHIKVTSEDFSSGGFDFAHSQVGSRKNRVRSFAMKTRLFEYVNQPDINVIAYVDCDVLFTVEGCATEMVRAGNAWEDTPIKFGRIFTDEKKHFQGLHAGSMLIHRNYSKNALKLWRDSIENYTEEGDNDAYQAEYFRIQSRLNETIPDGYDYTYGGDEVINPEETHHNNTASLHLHHNHHTKKGSHLRKNPLQPGELFSKQIPRVMNTMQYEKFFEPNLTKMWCITHISKARCNTFGRKSVQQFVDKFSLKTYHNKYPYCTHKILQPLLYGFFPFSCIPFCPKMEQIM